jgi:hypothetical protein
MHLAPYLKEGGRALCCRIDWPAIGRDIGTAAARLLRWRHVRSARSLALGFGLVGFLTN